MKTQVDVAFWSCTENAPKLWPARLVVRAYVRQEVSAVDRAHAVDLGVEAGMERFFLQPNGDITENGRRVGKYQPAGLFEEVAVWMYKQVAEVWKLDNEFAAKWASYAFGQEHRDRSACTPALSVRTSRQLSPTSWHVICEVTTP